MANLKRQGVGSRRYQITLAPVDALNGKLSQSTVVAKVLESSTQSGVKFYYGYQKSGVSRFALRTKSRNLADKPYSALETQQKTFFTQAVAAVKTTLENPDTKAQAIARFKAKGIAGGFKTLRGFLIAEKINELRESM